MRGFNALTALGVIITTIILAIIFKGFVLQVLWGWFIVPVFGLPILTISQALGLSLVISSIMPTPKEVSSAPFIGPAIALFIGWIIQFFI